MASLGKFASSAYQALVHIEDLKFQVAEREKAEAEVRELAKGLGSEDPAPSRRKYYGDLHLES